MESSDYLNLKGAGFADLSGCELSKTYGKIVQHTGNLLEAEGLEAATGDICKIVNSGSSHPILAEVVGFESSRVKLSPLTHLNGVRPGSLVQVHKASNSFMMSEAMLGRVLDGLGQPLDNGPPIRSGIPYPLAGKVSNPLARPLIQQQLDLGVRSINTLLPIGKGQRIGIFAGSGVGKSTLLGMIARYTGADVNVIALIGERGREVNEFLENDLGPEGSSAR